MSTTTIRLTDSMKARVAAAAERAGKTAHAFILDAIEQGVEQAELRAGFHDLADARLARLVASGETIPLASATDYFAARGRGETLARPKAKKLPRPA